MADQYMDVVGASMRSTALTSEGWEPHRPRLVLDGVDEDGAPVHLTIFGGAAAAEPARELAAAAVALAAASAAASERAAASRPGGDAA